MRITAIESIPVTGVNFPRPLMATWRHGDPWVGLSWVVTKVHTDEGLVGIGAAHGPVSPATQEYLIGKDPFCTEQHIQVLRQARGDWVVELCLWDLIGKACGQPLYRLWGGYTDRILAYASLVEMGSPQERREHAQQLVAEGYRAVKLRLRGDTVRQDVDLVAAVRDAVGDRLEIMVDANQAGAYLWPRGVEIWTYERALKTAQELEQLGVVWLEEPLPRYDLRSLAKLCDQVSIYIAGGEGNRGLHEFRWLIEDDVYDVIQPESLGSEGLSQLRKVAGHAEMHHKWFVPHNGISGVGMAAHLHLSASMPNSPYLEYLYDPAGCPAETFQALLTEPLRIDPEGTVRAPDKPGLGVELDEAFIAAHSPR